jgi:hypothetical protein
MLSFFVNYNFLVILRSPNAGKSQLSDGVTGNTFDFDSKESRFEPWSDNKRRKQQKVEVTESPVNRGFRRFWPICIGYLNEV